MKTLHDRLAKKGIKIEENNYTQNVKITEKSNDNHLEVSSPRVLANKLKPLPPLNKN